MKTNNGFHKIIKRIPYSTTSIDHQNILSILGSADEYEDTINKKISQFEQQGINISTCFDYFENMANEFIIKLLNQLETEHIKNMSTISYLFRKRASDKVEFQEFLNQLETEIATTKAEYDTLKRVADELNPLTNGRLSVERNAQTMKKEDAQNE